MDHDKAHDRILRNMSGEAKLRAAMNLNYSARKLKSAWLGQQHPDWSEEQVEQAVREAFAKAGMREY